MRKWPFIFIAGLLVLLAACGNSSESTGGGDPKAGGSTLDRLKKEGKVKLGVANEKPYGYKTSDGEVTGVAPEITKAVFKEMGIDTVEGEVTEFGSLIPALQAERFDVVTAGMDIRPERCAEAAFGDVEIRYGEGMAVQKGNPKNLHSYEDIAKNPDVKVSIMAG
ncbi:transporter substrate-binding domain-containing protein, partial [Siminovitchia fortis]